MANLFALTGDVLALQQRVTELAESPGASTEDLEALLSCEAEALDQFLAKAEGYCWAIKAFQASAAVRKVHAQRLQDLATEDVQQADRLLGVLTKAMAKVSPNQKTWRLASHAVARRKSETVQLEPEASELPKRYQRVKVEADKTLIKADLKAGVEIKGAQIVERQNWKLS